MTNKPDDSARAYREQHFAVRAEPSRDPAFDGERTIQLTCNGLQEYPVTLAPHEARKLFDLLGAEFGFLEDAAEDAAEVADLVAAEVLHHIDTMYPAMWPAVAKTARTSIRNVIKSHSKRLLAAMTTLRKE